MQALRHFTIERDNAFLHVDDQDDAVGRLQSHLDLFECSVDDHILDFLTAQEADTAGVHEREGPSAPLSLSRHAVASYPGHVMHNGDAPAGDAVEERGLADIGATDDGDDT